MIARTTTQAFDEAIKVKLGYVFQDDRTHNTYLEDIGNSGFIPIDLDKMEAQT